MSYILDDYAHFGEVSCVYSNKKYDNLIEAKEACSSDSSCVGIRGSNYENNLCTAMSMPLNQVLSHWNLYSGYKKKNLPGYFSFLHILIINSFLKKLMLCEY